MGSHSIRVEYLYQLDGGRTGVERLSTIEVPCEVRKLSEYLFMELVAAVAAWVESVEDDGERRYLAGVAVRAITEASEPG